MMFLELKRLSICFFCSTFIKGVVCSKNVKHKRMVSEHENPRILLLGGALEHQKVTNKLASINSILEQVIPPSFSSYSMFIPIAFGMFIVDLESVTCTGKGVF